MTQIVWYKRDLRVVDHEPLARAAAKGPVLPLYVLEPGYWARGDVSQRQLDFLLETLIDLDDQLTRRGAPLQVHVGSVTDALQIIESHTCIESVWSHEETGNLWTWQRDRAVAEWLAAREVSWHELPQHGVVRRLTSRDGWAARWQRQMAMPVTPAPESLCAEATVLFPVSMQVASPGVGQTGAELQLALQSKWQGLRRRLRETCVVTDQTPAPTRQPGGRQQALELLQSFFAHRGHAYHREMSGPATAEHSCSRLSAHLSLGSLSMRELVQAVWQHQAEIKALPAKQRDAATVARAKALNAYVARLHWHCHFIQKLEDSPHHEVEHVHRSYVGLRSEAAVNETLFQAWANGHTGFPLIDACMRSLRASGWINFRMRAMLMSFASFQLWLHWRQTGLHLARLFTDYEPGIHWNQVQMQSGTTGINTVRVYNPVKQSHDQDPDGEFIRRWVPELQSVDVDHIHEPWLMTSAQQRACDCIIGKHYPEPIVDHMQTAREARQRIYAVRNSKQFAAEADDIQSRHGSRKSGLPNRGEKRRRNSAAARPVESPQQSFGF